MTGIRSPLAYFAAQLLVRQGLFLLAWLFLYVVPLLVFPEGILLAVALAACGAASVLADFSMIALVPTAFPTAPSRQLARMLAVGVGLVVGFLCLTSAATPDDFATQAAAILSVRLTVPFLFALYAYHSFRDDVWPLLQQHGENTAAFRDALRERIERCGVEAHRRRDHVAAVGDARGRVISFYRENRAGLQGRFPPTWVETEVHARIPDAATDQEAYAAASALLETFAAHLRERQERLDTLDRQIGEVRAVRAAFAARDDLDPEMREEELAELARRERDLLDRRATLARAA